MTSPGEGGRRDERNSKKTVLQFWQGREVWIWSFLRWRHFWMAPYRVYTDWFSLFSRFSRFFSTIFGSFSRFYGMILPHFQGFNMLVWSMSDQILTKILSKSFGHLRFGTQNPPSQILLILTETCRMAPNRIFKAVHPFYNIDSEEGGIWILIIIFGEDCRSS